MVGSWCPGRNDVGGSVKHQQTGVLLCTACKTFTICSWKMYWQPRKARVGNIVGNILSGLFYLQKKEMREKTIHCLRYVIEVFKVHITCLVAPMHVNGGQKYIT